MWSDKLKQKMGRRAQAMVEFSLTLMIFLLVIFLLVEVGRLLYTYVVLQHAARMGASYGATGEWDASYNGISGCTSTIHEPLRDARTCSIEAMIEESMLGLQIDHDADSDEDYYFNTLIVSPVVCDPEYPPSDSSDPCYDPSPPDEPWTVFVNGFGGLPNQQIMVQAEYRVKIITPILSGIAPNVRLTSSAVMVNETFAAPGVQQDAVPPLPDLPDDLPVIGDVDLLVADITLPSHAVAEGQRATFEIEIRNDGVVPSGQRSEVMLYLDLDPDEMVGSASVDSVPAGGSVFASIDAIFNVEDDYSLCAMADSGYDVLEKDAEDNNVTCVPLHVNGPPSIDLQIDSIALVSPPPPPQVGDEVQFDVTVRNYGLNYSGDFRVGLYTDGSMAEEYLVDWEVVGGLLGGDPPESAPPTTITMSAYFSEARVDQQVYVMVDDEGAVGEVREDNNVNMLELEIRPIRCEASFEEWPLQGEDEVEVRGEPGTTVFVVDENTGGLIGTGTLSGSGYCGGTATISVNPVLVLDHYISLGNLYGGQTRIVLGEAPTAIFTPTLTPSYTPTFTPTDAPTPTATPEYVYVSMTPDCGPVGVNTVTFHGGNWPSEEGDIYIRLGGGLPVSIISAPPNGLWSWDETVDITFSDIEEHNITVEAIASHRTFTLIFETPCKEQETSEPPEPPPPDPDYQQYVNVGDNQCDAIVRFDERDWELSHTYVNNADSDEDWGLDPSSSITLLPSSGAEVLDSGGVLPLPSVDGNDGQELYKCRGYGEFTYLFEVPNGNYDVQLRFQEPQTSGDREFSIRIENGWVVQNLIIANEVGRHTRYDRTFTEIAVNDGVLEIYFKPKKGDPIVSAISVVTSGLTPEETPDATFTPTNTPTPPDLEIQSIELSSSNPNPQQAFVDEVVFDVVVQNNGEIAATSLFWVDLYADPPEPVGNSIPSMYGVDFVGVSGLAGGASRTLQLSVPYFATTGTHNVYAMADTTNRIIESHEENNVGGPSVVTVNNDENITPTVAPASTDTPDTGTGNISGHTWINAGGEWDTPTGRVQILVWQGDTLIAQTESESDGSYTVTNLLPGTYTVQGLVDVDGDLYAGEHVGAIVVSGVTTQNVDLFLSKVMG